MQGGGDLPRHERLLPGAHRRHGARSAVPVSGEMLHNRAYGWQSAGQMFSPTFMRHMYDYGTTPAQVAAVRSAHSMHASNNPKAYYKQRLSVEDVLASRIICKPLHLLDCCVETDNATAIIVTGADRAKDGRHPRALIRGVAGRVCKPRIDMHYQAGRSRPWRGVMRARSCGRTPASARRTSTSPAPTTPSPSPPCCSSRTTASARRAKAASYVSDGTIRLGGKRPNNTSGGHLCEGYTHGMNMVIENVRQLRHDVDDSCPVGADGKRRHTYDYKEGGCRQVKTCEVTANLGWAMPGTGSAMVMRRG